MRRRILEQLHEEQRCRRLWGAHRRLWGVASSQTDRMRSRVLPWRGMVILH
jgi:hypothetical protein